MPTGVSQLFFVLIMTMGLAACVGLPAQPISAEDMESSPISPVSPVPSLAPMVPLSVPESPLVNQAGQAPSDQALSTPALINQTLDRGEIDADQRLLYLAYAIYEYESLPVQFHGSVGWRGTEYVRTLRQAVDTPETFCAMEPAIQNELIRLVPGSATCK